MDDPTDTTSPTGAWWSADDVAQWAEQFPEEDADGADRPAEATSVSIPRDFEIHRMWRCPAGEDGKSTIDKYVRLFNEFTSSKNKVPQMYVDDPMINKTIFAGRYRQAFIRAYPQRAGTGKECGGAWKIVQTLRRGFLMALAELQAGYNPLLLPDPDVRLVKASVFPQTDKVNTVSDSSIGTGDGGTRYFYGSFDAPSSLLPGSVYFTDGRQVVTDDGQGNLIGDIGAGANGVSYSARNFQVNFLTAPPVGAIVTGSCDYLPDPNDASMQLVRKWSYINPDLTSGFLAALKPIKYVMNPVASFDVYRGKWLVGKVWAEKAEDGSDSIFEELYLNLAADWSERYTVNYGEDMLLIYKEGLSRAQLDGFMSQYQRDRIGTFAGGVGGNHLSDYLPGIHNEITISFDAATGTYSVSLHQQTFYDLSTPVTSQDPSGMHESGGAGGVPDGPGGGTPGSTDGLIGPIAEPPYVDMYLYRVTDKYKVYRADYHNSLIEPVLTKEDQDQLGCKLEKQMNPLKLWDGSKDVEVTLGDDEVPWPETITGYVHYEDKVPYGIIVCKKYFATAMGAMQYCGASHGSGSPALNIIAITAGIPKEVMGTGGDDTSYFDDTANWEVIHTDITRKNNVLMEALRIERLWYPLGT